MNEGIIRMLLFVGLGLGGYLLFGWVGLFLVLLGWFLEA